MVFTARDIDFSGSSATVGLAYRPGSCGSSLYQVDEYRNFPIAGMAAVTAHETGHNLNAVHDGAAGFIMSSSVNFSSPATTWSAASVTTINARYPSQACIANCTTLGTPAADFIATSPRGCVNTNITFTDLSTNEPTGWNWSFASGTPVSASTQNPTAQWSSPGNYTVGLTSTNSAGSSTPIAKNSYAQVIAAPSNPCSPTGATLGNLGITSFQLNTISNSSGDAATDGSNYLNLSCSQSTTLTPSTSYTGTIVLPQFAAIRVWIDYNDNTSFGDANELIHASANGVLWSGTYNFIFTTPASPSGSKLLRLRVRAYSNSFDSNPCSGYASATGQTEDYAVYFESVLPVELTQFSGKWQNDYAALTWQTATENQNKGFEIERSLDGKQFDKVGFVAAKGGNQTTDYWFNDYETSKNTTPQYIYYRLKQIDENGGYRYSKVILLATNHKVQWTVSPNPSKGLFNINTIQSANNTFDIDVVDMLGRSIYHQHKASVNANAPLSIDMSLIAAGVYILKISQPQQPLFVSRLVKN